MDRDTAERCTILRGLVGSTVHGLNVNDGIEDRDEMGVCVEPLAEAMALWDPFEQFIYRSAAEREGQANARSTGGDLDLTIYGLRKWTTLTAEAGNCKPLESLIPNPLSSNPESRLPNRESRILVLLDAIRDEDEGFADQG